MMNQTMVSFEEKNPKLISFLKIQLEEVVWLMQFNMFNLKAKHGERLGTTDTEPNKNPHWPDEGPVPRPTAYCKWIFVEQHTWTHLGLTSCTWLMDIHEL